MLCERERARAGVSTGAAAGGSESRAGGLKRAFANLEVLALRVWDPSVGKDEEWWAERVRRWLPTLCAIGVVELDVRRDTCTYTNLRTCTLVDTDTDANGLLVAGEQHDLLWDPEDFELSKVGMEIQP